MSPVERHPKLSAYFDRHVSRGDLLSLDFGQYPLPHLFHLRLHLPPTMIKKYHTSISQQKKEEKKRKEKKRKEKKRRYLAYSLSYFGIGTLARLA
jgi:hypothetical protein